MWLDAEIQIPTEVGAEASYSPPATHTHSELNMLCCPRVGYTCYQLWCASALPSVELAVTVTILWQPKDIAAQYKCAMHIMYKFFVKSKIKLAHHLIALLCV